MQIKAAEISDLLLGISGRLYIQNGLNEDHTRRCSKAEMFHIF